jgi:hypothetical protein
MDIDDSQGALPTSILPGYAFAATANLSMVAVGVSNSSVLLFERDRWSTSSDSPSSTTSGWVQRATSFHHRQTNSNLQHMLRSTAMEACSLWGIESASICMRVTTATTTAAAC